MDSNLDTLFQLQIRDGAGSSGAHQTFHWAFYYNTTGHPIEILPITYAVDPVIFCTFKSEPQLINILTVSSVLIVFEYIDAYINAVYL